MEAGIFLAGAVWAIVIVSAILSTRSASEMNSVWATCAKRLGFTIKRHRRAISTGNSQAAEILRATGFGRELAVTFTASSDTIIDLTLDGTFTWADPTRLAKVLDGLGHPQLPRHMNSETRARIENGRLIVDVLGQPWRDGDISELLAATLSLGRLLDDDAVAQRILQLATKGSAPHTRSAALDLLASSTLPRPQVIAVARGAVADASGRGLLVGALLCFEHAPDAIDDSARGRIYAALRAERGGDLLHGRLIRHLVADAAGVNPSLGAELVAALRSFEEHADNASLSRVARTAARTVRASLADSNAGQLAVFAPAGDAGSLAVSDDARLLAHGHGDEDDAEEVEEASALRAGR